MIQAFAMHVVAMSWLGPTRVLSCTSSWRTLHRRGHSEPDHRGDDARGGRRPQTGQVWAAAGGSVAWDRRALSTCGVIRNACTQLECWQLAEHPMGHGSGPSRYQWRIDRGQPSGAARVEHAHVALFGSALDVIWRCVLQAKWDNVTAALVGKVGGNTQELAMQRGGHGRAWRGCMRGVREWSTRSTHSWGMGRCSAPMTTGGASHPQYRTRTGWR